MANYLIEASSSPFTYHAIIKIGDYYFAFYNAPSTAYGNIYYETSTDLQTWSNKTFVATNTQYGDDVIYWKNKIWILYSKTDTKFYVMSGTVTGTSISWDTPVVVWDANTGRTSCMTLSSDETILYVFMRSYLGGSLDYSLKVKKSSDGAIWTEIFYSNCNTVDYAMSIEICPHPTDDDGCMILVDNKNYCSQTGGASFYSKLYDGTSWGAWVKINDGLANYSWQRAKKFGSEIILMWGPNVDFADEIEIWRYSGGVWTWDFTIADADSQARFGLSVGCSEENIYIVYQKWQHAGADSHKVFIRKYNGSTWSDEEEVETLTANTILISTIRESKDLYTLLPIIYRENAANPLDTRVCTYTTSETPPEECIIKLNGVCYDHIIDTLFTESKTVFLPEWINDETPDIDINIWTRKVGSITYVLRVTDLEKWTLDQVLTGHILVLLTDTIYGLININVWLRMVEVEWEGNVNWANPWKITIELITERITRT